MEVPGEVAKSNMMKQLGISTLMSPCYVGMYTCSYLERKFVYMEKHSQVDLVYSDVQYTVQSMMDIRQAQSIWSVR